MLSERDKQLIGPIAAFIGARLQYSYPEINGQGNPWVSTIRVDQHKEKWWAVRIYCKLADSTLVQKKWDWLKANPDHQSSYPARLYENDFTAVEPTALFKAQCMYSDALHYRRCYLDMVALQPHLRSPICSQADYHELLLEQFVEIEATVDKMTDEQINFHSRTVALAGTRKGLKEFLRSVYEPGDNAVHLIRD